MNEEEKRHKKIVFGILVMVIISGIAGFMVHAGSNNYEKQQFSDKLMQHCKNELLPAYESGFMTSLIKDLDAFALNCVGGDVNLYSWGNMDGSKNGVLFMCNTTQETYPLKYPNTEEFKK